MDAVGREDWGWGTRVEVTALVQSVKRREGVKCGEDMLTSSKSAH